MSCWRGADDRLPPADPEFALQPDRQGVHGREYRALGDVLRDYPKVFIACDDIYEHIYWGDGPFALSQRLPRVG